MPDDTTVYAGAMPSRQGQIALEMHGMAPIPAENRYGTLRDAGLSEPVHAAA
jgi:hypothetical protein